MFISVFPDDFDAPFISYLVFEPCQRTACSTSDILIREDTKVELTETISLGLQTSQSDLIRLDPQSAMIEISDAADSKRESVCVCTEVYIILIAGSIQELM